MKTDSTMIVRDQLYIGGKWVKPAGTGTLDVTNSSTEEVMARIPDGTPADVDRAVAAAKAAFPAWSQTPVAERAAMLQKLSGRARRAHGRDRRCWWRRKSACRCRWRSRSRPGCRPW